MSNKLRIEKNKWLEINCDLLSPKLGCGLALQQVPKFHISAAMDKVLSAYKIKNAFADGAAQKILQDEKIIKQFYTNAVSSMPIEENFQSALNNITMYMLIDFHQESVWFIANVDGRLAFINYFRDVVPNIFKQFNLGFSGSLARLLPIGWQNLFDVIDSDFIRINPEVKTIEILSVLIDVRFRSSILGIGTNLLNHNTPDEITKKIQEILPKKDNV